MKAMRAVVVEPFPGLPDGESVVKNFKEGDLVVGDLAEVAVREGWAQEVDEDYEPDEDPAPAPKAKAEGKGGKTGKKAKASSSGSEGEDGDQ